MTHSALWSGTDRTSCSRCCERRVPADGGRSNLVLTMPKQGNDKSGKKRGNNNDKSEDICAYCKISEANSDKKDKWVTCFVCHLWHHIHCITDSEQTKAVIQEEEDVFIRCRKCRKVDIDNMKFNTTNTESLWDFCVDESDENNSPRKLSKKELGLLKSLRDNVTALANENSFLRSEVSEMGEFIRDMGNENKSLKGEVAELRSKIDYLGDMIMKSIQFGRENRDEIMKSLEKKTDKLVQEGEKSRETIMKKVEDKVEDLADKGEKSKDTIVKKVDEIKHDNTSDNNPKTFAAVVIKALDKENKASDKSKEIGKILSDIPLEQTTTTKDGHLLVRIKDKADLDKAVQTLSKEKEKLGIEANIKNKLKPKIMITNVPKMESKDDIVANILCKNQWLKSIVDKGEEFSLVASLNGRIDSSQNFIFKCSPQIRKLLIERDDKILTLFSKCQVYDHYNILQCFKCLKFGHHSSKCSSKDQICAKCSGKHRLADCKHIGDPCCANCKSEDVKADHRANSRTCPKVISETNRVKNITDHGL